MKKMFTFLAAVAVSATFFAQVTVTYQIDVTDYVADGNTVSEFGIRIAGNFTTSGADAILDWSPSDDNSTLTDLGNNIWSIDVVYPAGSVGQTQTYKYVNGNDWGMNEGDVALADCGEDDNNGGFNRTLTIPAENATVCFSWNNCVSCPTGSIANNTITSLSVYPNPATEFVTFSVELNNASVATVKVMDLAGRVITTQTLENNKVDVNVAHLAAGTYMYEVVAGDAVAAGRFIKK